MLLAIDPGKEGLALALFDGTTFVGGSVFRAPKGARLGVQCLELWRDASYHMSNLSEVAHVAVEEMCRYPGPASARDSAQTADLLHLQAIGAYIAGHFACPITYYPARVWKGQVSRTIEQKRTLEKLSTSELETLRVCSVSFGARAHNLLSAVGIGQYHIMTRGPC